MKYRFAALVWLCGVSSCTGAPPQSVGSNLRGTATPTAPPTANLDCRTDDDCGFARRGCCGCGADPIRKDQASAMTLYWRDRCTAEGTACRAVIDERPICFTKPICAQGKCSNSVPNRQNVLPEDGGE